MAKTAFIILHEKIIETEQTVPRVLVVNVLPILIAEVFMLYFEVGFLGIKWHDLNSVK